MIQEISQVLALILQCATLITIIYGVIKFVNKPTQKLDVRLDEHDKRLDTIDARLDAGSNHFDQLDEGNRHTQEALLALLEHAIDGNNTTELKKAKDNLQSYLIRK